MSFYELKPSELPPFSRYRSKRSRLRKRKQAQEKNIRQAWLRYQTVEKAIRDIPLLPLPEPYQKGWQRFFVLREDIKQSALASFYEEILKTINTVQYSETRQFVKKARRKGKKIYLPREQHLKRFSLVDWYHPKCPLSERQRAHFGLVEYFDATTQCWRKEYEFLEPWRYVWKIAPRWITHYRPVHELLEREKALLEYKLFDCKPHYAILQNRVFCPRNAYKAWRKSKSEQLFPNPLKNLSQAQKQFSFLCDFES
ncbi:MAG: hypothetical protein Q4B71_05180 [Cardiobacteriaceae bacterium]|nr:hypothetical protein [Cardiobacteriaceae bacterium]